MSRATSHAAVAGLRLSGERRAKSGHMSAPDPCLCRGPLCPGTLLRLGPHSGGPGTHPGDPTCLLGSSGPVCTGVRCPSVEVQTHRYTPGCIIFPCHVVPLDLPMWWGLVPFSAWPGSAVRVQRLHVVEDGTPRFRVPTESEQLPCWLSKDTFFWIELPPVPPQAVEDQLQILNEVF
jgi:hypothetical protein